MNGADLSLAHTFAEGDAAQPVLLLLHGTGGGPDDLLGLARALNPRSAVLAPAGPVSENGSARWFRRLSEGVFDTRDVIDRAHQLADFVQDARERYGFGDRRLVAVGFSNGANIAAALLLLRPDVLREAVLFAAMSPLPSSLLPTPGPCSGTRAFMANGEHDPMAPLVSAEQLVSALRERSAQVEVLRHPGGHEVTIEGVRAATAWLARARS